MSSKAATQKDEECTNKHQLKNGDSDDCQMWVNTRREGRRVLPSAILASVKLSK
jgi:hypothetical protein